VTAILHNVARPGDASEAPRWLGDPASPSRIMILNGHAEAWTARSGGGAFSVKWAPRGRVAYQCEGDTHVVRPDGLMLLNGGQPYEMAFRGPSETFCLFYSQDLVRQAWGGDAPEFPNLIFRPAFGGELARVRAELADGWPDDLEARLLLILDAAVAAARAHRGEARRTGAAKASTRARLLARLDVARALIADGEAGNLDQVARAAGLSKFHLLRLFKAAFGQTPMKYAEGLRLDHAAERLRSSGALVDEIAYAAGYESLSAFGRAFRRRFGAAPTAYRRARRN
jgi:AraC family transcriptional regulator